MALCHCVQAPLLQPLATAMQMLSGVRESQAIRLQQVVCAHLEDFLEDLRLYRVSYETFELRKTECDALRANYLGIPSTGGRETEHALAASALDDAKLALEAARAVRISHMSLTESECAHASPLNFISCRLLLRLWQL